MFFRATPQTLSASGGRRAARAIRNAIFASRVALILADSVHRDGRVDGSDLSDVLRCRRPTSEAVPR